MTIDAPDQLWWYTARAGGLVSWALLAAGVLWGLSLSTKVLHGKPRPNWQLDLHRYLGGLSVVFVGIHVAAIVLDGFVEFGLTDVLVPFASDWSPLAVAWGVVAFYLLLAVELTSLLRRRIPPKVWKLTHMASFPLYATGTIHMLAAGTERHAPILLAVVAATTLAIAGLTAVRIVQSRRPATVRPVRPRPVAAGVEATADRPDFVPTAPVPVPNAPAWADPFEGRHRDPAPVS